MSEGRRKYHIFKRSTQNMPEIPESRKLQGILRGITVRNPEKIKPYIAYLSEINGVNLSDQKFTENPHPAYLKLLSVEFSEALTGSNAASVRRSKIVYREGDSDSLVFAAYAPVNDAQSVASIFNRMEDSDKGTPIKDKKFYFLESA